MPGDTKIKRSHTGQGWIDVDDPVRMYGSRRLARDARRVRLGNSLPTKATSVPRPTTVVVQNIAASPNDGLSGLQHRLFTRLTFQQGVTNTDALMVIDNYGYNQAASYGHMRAAGANHSEALSVILLESPDLSVAYGRARAAGYNHTGALAKAIREVNGDDTDD